ncbi:MAG: hypothetical protein QM778_04920 [Myxococcales bacterium]
MLDVSSGFDAPGDGWINVTRPQGTAFLGGTGVGWTQWAAQTDLEFQVTSSATQYNTVANGPRRQVCAQLAARSACKLVEACWHGDGGWTIERLESPGRPEQDHEELCEILSRFGENSVFLAQDNGLNVLPPLVNDGTTYRILAKAWAGDSPNLTVEFYKNNALVKSVVVPNQPLGTDVGFAGLHTDRVTIHTKLKGTAPFQPPAVSGNWLTASGLIWEYQGPFSCSYLPYASRAAAPTNLRLTTNEACNDLVMRVDWNPPAGVASPDYQVFRDGQPLGITKNPFAISYNVVPNTTYTFQVGYSSNGGPMSHLASLTATSPAPCLNPEYANVQTSTDQPSKADLGVILVRYEDAPGGNRPHTIQEVRDLIFGQGYTVGQYVSTVSRGKAGIIGDVHGDANGDWITLAGETIAKNCQCTPENWATCSAPPSAPIGRVGNQCALPADILARVRAAGVPVDNYERLIYFLQGSADAGVTAGSAVMRGKLSPDALAYETIDRSTFVHEMIGHGIGNLMHSGSWSCPNGDTGPWLADLSAGGCQALKYGYFEPMGGVRQTISLFSTHHLWNMNWLQPAEIVSDTNMLGGTWTLSELFTADPSSSAFRSTRTPSTSLSTAPTKASTSLRPVSRTRRSTRGGSTWGCTTTRSSTAMPTPVSFARLDSAARCRLGIRSATNTGASRCA